MNHPIFHITHADNLPGIIGMGRLWCDAQREAQGFNSTSIGYSHIKARRLRHPVTVVAGGNLGDYVPFNFCPRSVMLYVIYCGHEDYRGGQESIVHLVSSVQAIVGSGRPWAFTDRHADLGYARQFDSLDKLDEVDWSIMNRTYWNESEIKEKRQAEFLVHNWCPWTVIENIAVYDASVKVRVLDVLKTADHRPAVEIRREWYY